MKIYLETSKKIDLAIGKMRKISIVLNSGLLKIAATFFQQL
jgi:hypothetical protein